MERDEGRRGLALLVGWSTKGWGEFLTYFEGDLSAFWAASTQALEGLSFLTAGQRKRLIYLHRHGEAELVEAVRSWPGRILLFDEEDFPRRLHDMEAPPVALHILGNVEALHRPGIAVVGSRKIGVHSAQAARELLMPASRRGMNIISGGALGADAVAHRSAVDAGGCTVAVLPSGLTRPSPRSNRDLFDDILENEGALISEYAPNKEVRTFHFPRRNHIIAALGRGVFVVRAKQKSGTMLTVEAARQLGRPLAAMPGEPQNPLAVGCHEILRDGGELIATSAHLQDWWRMLSPESAHKMSEAQGRAPAQQVLWPPCEVLEAAQQVLDEDGAFSLERLATVVERPAAQLQALMLEHEMAGWVEPVFGGERYRFCNA